MAPPKLLFCDTDCLIQLFIANKTQLLRWFRLRYGIEAVVVPEVESEISWHAKFRDRYDQPMKKAIANGQISVFHYSRTEQLSELFPVPHAATATAQAIGRTGSTYALRVGDGEAYSHATCVHLGMPLLSHDRNAINTLLYNNLQTAAPVLRVFDLITLAYKVGEMSVKECDSIRQSLDLSREFLPRCFKHSSFERGLNDFNPRLHEVPAGGQGPVCTNFNDPYFVAPVR